MRLTVMLPLVGAISYLPLTAATCGSNDPVPVINSVEFPAEIRGDNLPVAGSIDFVDANAGVEFMHLESVSCPTGYICSSSSFDLKAEDPEIINYYSGTIAFNMQCNNPTGNDVTLAYAWTLEDIEGNLSEPADFAFTCVGANKSPVPVITGLSFPSSIPGNKTAVTGSFTFVDGNAGVRYATLASVSCPTGFSCPAGTIDLTSSNPGIVNALSGTINFSLSCDNQYTTDAVFKYSWSLKDTEGNISQPWEFAFTCKTNSSARASAPSGLELEGVSSDRLVLPSADLGRVRVTLTPRP